MKRHVLFVCYANKNRSPAAERIFSEMAKAAGYTLCEPGTDANQGCSDYDIGVLSAGTGVTEVRRQLAIELGEWVMKLDFGRQMTRELGDWATEIYAMDSHMRQSILRCYKQPTEKVLSLGIADIYPKTDDYELECVLREKLAPLVRGPFGMEIQEAIGV